MTSWAPHSFSLRQLQYLVAIWETRSFRRAAARCRVSQPSLSSQVAQVERAIGVRLFERDRRRVLLTAAGAALLPRARQLLVEADDLVDAAARLGDPFAGTLRVGVIPTVSPYLLPEIAPALRRAHPRLQIVWTEDKTPTLAQQLAAGELDAALLALEAELGEVEHEVIGRDAFVLAVGSTHPLAKASRPIAAAELDGVELLLLAEGHCLRDQSIAACGRRRVHQSPFGATSLATLTQMVAAGRGVTLLPELALATENRRGQLHLRGFKAPAPGRTLALVWRRGGAFAAAAAALAGTIRHSYERRRARHTHA
jgi:LysR family hydrogen peroxide-inducible transcriptional activator